MSALEFGKGKMESSLERDIKLRDNLEKAIVVLEAALSEERVRGRPHEPVTKRTGTGYEMGPSSLPVGSSTAPEGNDKAEELAKQLQTYRTELAAIPAKQTASEGYLGKMRRYFAKKERLRNG